MLLLGHDETVAAWVGAKVGRQFIPPYAAIGIVDRTGALTGGYMFTGYNGDGIELSVAGRGAAHRDGWNAVLNYVFGQLGCKRLQMHTSNAKKNKRVRKQLHDLGIRFEGIARRFYGKDDAACFGLTIDDLAEFRAKWRL